MRQPIETLLKAYYGQDLPKNPQTLVFQGVDGYDVYNPSAPFEFEGKTLILARVEKRDSEVSQAVYFEWINDIYVRRTDLTPLDLQDPCITKIGSDYVVGGTYVFHENGQVRWYTRFYKGPHLNNLKVSLNAPMGMKDVRLIELPDGRIGVFSRPQGDKGKRGQIGFDIAANYDSVTTEFIDQAPLFDQFILTEWGGANHLILLDDHTIGVLGHIANFSGNDIRHYYAMTFTVDTRTKQASPMKLIAAREQFNPGPSKRQDLIDVLFSAALVPLSKNTYTLYVGVSDAEVQTIEVTNPFE